MAGRATTPQGRKLGYINNMPNRRYLPSINFSVPFARWSHFYVSIDWTNGEYKQFIHFQNLIQNFSFKILKWDFLLVQGVFEIRVLVSGRTGQFMKLFSITFLRKSITN
jgi:hypothetical protein